MNVLYTCDNNYVWLMGISMISLFENNVNEDEINVFLLGEKISEENQCHLTHISQQYDRRCIVIQLENLDIPKELYSQRWPKSAYTRLYAGQLLPLNLHKVLYIDCDTIITGSLNKLWKLDENQYVVMGVKDCISKIYKKNIGLKSEDIYINAGVLLFNLNLLRDYDISIAISRFIDQYGKKISYADQDILNSIFKGKIGILSPEYNLMTLVCMYSYENIISLRRPTNYYSEKEITMGTNNPRIVHFTTCMRNVKPWFQESDHPYCDYFEYFKRKSPWSEKEKNIAVFNSIKDKILKIILIMPISIRFKIIGIIHGYLKPCLKKLAK